MTLGCSPERNRRRLQLQALLRPAWNLGNAGTGLRRIERAEGEIPLPPHLTISAGIAGGLLIQKTTPVYPPMAKEARVSGTVVIQATISRTGTSKISVLSADRRCCGRPRWMP